MSMPVDARIARRARLLAVLTAAALAAALLPAQPAGAQVPSRADLVFACPDFEVPEPAFTDIAGNTFEQAIACLVHYQITAGRTPTLYDPGGTVNRAQMATFFARLIDYAARDGYPALPAYDNTNDFSDVTDPTHLNNINRLAQAGIVQGGPGGRPASQYGPELPVTRAQMASFINRVQGYLQGDDLTGDYGFDPGTSSFPDVGPATEPHTRNINAIASVGVTQGDAQGRFNPGNGTTRGQMAAFIMRHVDVNVETGDLHTPLVQAGAPLLKTIDPDSGHATDTVTITGVNLANNTGATVVRFDNVAAANVEVNEDGTELTADVPELPGITGESPVDVTLTAGTRESVNTLVFLYQSGETVDPGTQTVITAVRLIDDAPTVGEFDSGDVLDVVFNQQVTGADSADYAFADGDGTRRHFNCGDARVTCTFDTATNTLRIPMTVAPPNYSGQYPGTVPGLQYSSARLTSVKGTVTGVEAGPLHVPEEGVPVTLLP